MVTEDEELSLPGDTKPAFSMSRLALWLLVGGFGAYLLVSGIVGMLGKG